MNKISSPSKENITIVCKDSNIYIQIEYNYEIWETVVELEDYKCYGCENEKDLQNLLQESITSQNSGEVVLSFSDTKLFLVFLINLGFKQITKNLSIPKIREISPVEKLELYVKDKFDEKDKEIQLLKQKIKEYDQIITRLSEYLDYTMIGNSIVSISQTKNLKICTFDVSRYSNVNDFCDFGKNFTVVLISGDTPIGSCGNIKYLKNLESLVFSTTHQETISDLSFLELPRLEKLKFEADHTYIGKNPIRIPKIEICPNNIRGLTIVKK